MPPIRLGLVGVGKIARDQHFPAIEATTGVELVAVASRSATLEGVENFKTLGSMLAGVPLDAVVLCTPPQVRRALALEALAAGKHVFLEKPPGATLSEMDDLTAAAEGAGVTLFASWHSRFAPAVEPARRWLADRQVARATINWKEDVERWHPGQDWIFEPGGLGVFDPGINALSIATRILPRPFFLTEGTLSFPANRQAPIAASLSFADAGGMAMRAEFDWRQKGPQTWDITLETDDGKTLSLSQGGRLMHVDGETASDEPEAEYRGLYERFVALVAERRSEVDLAPLVHVADAFMVCRRETVEPFLPA